MVIHAEWYTTKQELWNTVRWSIIFPKYIDRVEEKREKNGPWRNWSKYYDNCSVVLQERGKYTHFMKNVVKIKKVPLVVTASNILLLLLCLNVVWHNEVNFSSHLIIPPKRSNSLANITKPQFHDLFLFDHYNKAKSLSVRWLKSAKKSFFC